MVPAVMLAPPAYLRSSQMIIALVDPCGCQDDRYTRLPTESHRMSGSMKIMNKNMESVSHCRKPLWMGMGIVSPCIIIQQVLDAAYSCLQVSMQESRIPYSLMIMKSILWSIPPKSPLKSEWAVIYFVWIVLHPRTSWYVWIGSRICFCGFGIHLLCH